MDDDDQYQAGYDVGSFPKDFGYTSFDGEGDGSAGPLAGEQKPRILLMGLRRFFFVSTESCLSHTHIKPKFSFQDHSTESHMDLANVTEFKCMETKNLSQQKKTILWEKLSTMKPSNIKIYFWSGKSSIQKVVFHKMSPNETLFLESTNKIIKDDISNSSFVQFQIWDFPGQIDFFDPTFDSDMIFGGCGALVFVIDAQDDYMDALNKLHMTVTKAYKVNQTIKFEVFIHKVDGLSDDYKMETQRDIHTRANDDLADSGYDQIHLSFHLTSIYDHSIFEAFSKVVQKLIPQLPTLENLLNILISNSAIEKAFLFDVVSKIYIATDSSPVDMQSYELCCDMIDVVIDVSCIYGLREDLEAAAFDNQSSSLIKLNNGTILYLREVNKFLALVCILREDNFDRQGVIDYNFLCFRKAIQQVFELRNKALAAANAHNHSTSPISVNEPSSEPALPQTGALVQSGTLGQNGIVALTQS